MTFGKWTRVLLFAAPFVTGCAGFWVNPNSTSSNTSFSLTNSGNLSVTPGASTGNTATITVTPANSFTGTVNVACTVSSAPSGATSPTTCGVSPTSVSITSATTPVTTTLTATTTSTTTTGTYNITVTGTSGSLSATTTLCVEVSTSSSATCTATTASGVFYVLNSLTNQVVALSISSSGTLTTVGTTPLAATGLTIAVAPNGKFMYVSTAAGIYVYEIGSTGALTVGNSGGVIVQDPATAIKVDTTNGWLVEAISESSQIFAVAINSSNGTLAVAGEQEQPFNLPIALPASVPPGQLAISPNDSSTCSNCYVFVAMGSGGTELVHFNPANANPFGTSAQLKLVSSLGGANAVAVDPSNRLLYVGESNALPSATQTGGLRALTISSGGATEISGSPYSTGGTGPVSILPTPNGNFVYVANRSVSGSGSDLIASFSVSTAALTSIGTTPTTGPTGAISLAEDSTGTYLLATDFAGNPDLEAFTMNAGVLTSVLTAATGTTNPVGATAVTALP